MTGSVVVAPFVKAPPPALKLADVRVSPARACVARTRTCRTPGTSVQLRLSIAATVRITLTRRGGRSPARTVVRALGPGSRHVPVSLKGLGTGPYRVAVSASDTNGQTATAPARVLTIRSG
jgi:hypothetical protein